MPAHVEAHKADPDCPAGIRTTVPARQLARRERRPRTEPKKARWCSKLFQSSARLQRTVANRTYCQRGNTVWGRNPQPPELAKLGITDFEMPYKTGKLQKDILEFRERPGLARLLYGGLADCTGAVCGRPKCAEVCPYGQRRRRLHMIPAVHQLLSEHEGPIFEVRAGRGAWCRPVGELETVKIAAVRAAFTRALDRLLNPTLIALGMFKVILSRDEVGPFWAAQVHLVVAGAERDQLREALSSMEGRTTSDDFVRVDPVVVLGPVLDDSLRGDLYEGHHHPALNTTHAKRRAKRSRRREFYDWLFTLQVNGRLLRYGCDSEFKKAPRRRRASKSTFRVKKSWRTRSSWRNLVDPQEDRGYLLDKL